jgi:glycosyltransferase involved in cell wall biosynthesis
MGLLTRTIDRARPVVLVVCDDWLVYGPIVDAWASAFARRPRLAPVVRRMTGLPTTLPDLGQVDAVCFVSDYVRRAAAEHTPWTFRRSTVTFSGLDREDFPPLRADDAAGPWRGRLLYVGRLDPRKGVETVLQALARLPADHTLEVVGPGEASYRRELDKLVDTLGLGARVRFADVPRDAVRARYLAADAVVFPSEWQEPFGLIPLEAMACGRPVIATGTGGSGEYLVDGANCLLFTPGDHESLARAIESLGTDAGLRARLIAGGTDTADGFDTDRLADVLENWHVAAAQRFAGGEPAERMPPGLIPRP